MSYGAAQSYTSDTDAAIQDPDHIVEMVNEIVTRSNVLALQVASDAAGLVDKQKMADAAEKVHLLATQTAQAAEDVLQEIALLQSRDQASLESVICAEELSDMISRLDEMTALFNTVSDEDEAQA